MTGILDLPGEILTTVFGLLPPSDIKSIVLVSKQWMVLGEHPNFWTWAIVTVNIKADLLKLKKRRLQKLMKIKVSNWFDGSQSLLIQSTSVKPEELFEALLPITTLTSIGGLIDENVGSITFRGTDYPDLSGIEPEVFARVLSRLSCLSFDFIRPTPPQYGALLSAIAQKESHVKKLVFGFHQITASAKPDVFAAAISNIEECDFGTFCVPSQHMQALCVAVAEEQGQLKKLKVFCAFLSSIAPAILGIAISRLESVCIDHFSGLLSKEQIQAILYKAGEDGSHLKMLRIVMNEEQKEELDQDVLRQAGQKIGAVQWTTVSTVQVNAHIIKHVLTICARA